jgi:hypothetical protein
MRLLNLDPTQHGQCLWWSRGLGTFDWYEVVLEEDHWNPIRRAQTKTKQDAAIGCASICNGGGGASITTLIMMIPTQRTSFLTTSLSMWTRNTATKYSKMEKFSIGRKKQVFIMDKERSRGICPFGDEATSYPVGNQNFKQGSCSIISIISFFGIHVEFRNIDAMYGYDAASLLSTNQKGNK